MDGHEANRFITFHHGKIQLLLFCNQALDVGDVLIKSAEGSRLELSRIFVQTEQMSAFGKHRGEPTTRGETRVHENVTDQAVYRQGEGKCAVTVELLLEACGLLGNFGLGMAFPIEKKRIV